MIIMRKVKIFLRGMARGMDVTAIFGGGGRRLRRLAQPNTSMADDWAAAGRDLQSAIDKYQRPGRE